MRNIINLVLEFFFSWRVKDQANDWYEARKKAQTSRDEVERIVREHDATIRKDNI